MEHTTYHASLDEEPDRRTRRPVTTARESSLRAAGPAEAAGLRFECQQLCNES
jgi:hypothetical protein